MTKKIFSFTNSKTQVITLAGIRNDIGFGKMGTLMCCQEPYKLLQPFCWVIWQNSSDKKYTPFTKQFHFGEFILKK